MISCVRSCALPECSSLFTEGIATKKYCTRRCAGMHLYSLNREHYRRLRKKWYKLNRAKVLKYTAAWETLNPEKLALKRAKVSTKDRRGVTPEEFETRIQQQRNRCPIGNHLFVERGRAKQAPVLDHDHKNGINRAIICREHNTALGMFHDSLAELQAASAYLRSWRKKHVDGLQQIA
jgi:Recombination endonuclease VII